MDYILFNLCLQFKTRICSELHDMPQNSRDRLKGDYLFIIDDIPRFIMLIDEKGVWSVLIKQKDNVSKNTSFDFDIDVDENYPFSINKKQVNEIIENSARCRIKTDEKTLKRILLGTLRARVAFIAQRIKISGDFPAFLKIISYLKTRNLKQKDNAFATS